MRELVLPFMVYLESVYMVLRALCRRVNVLSLALYGGGIVKAIKAVVVDMLVAI